MAARLNLHTKWLPKLPMLIKKLEACLPENIANEIGHPELADLAYRRSLQGSPGLQAAIEEMSKKTGIPDFEIRKQMESGFKNGEMAEFELDEARDVLDTLKISRVFDCRSIPMDFIEDSGDTFWEELQETKAKIHLPFENCYFEFPNGEGALGTTIPWEGPRVDIYYFTEDRPAIESAFCSFSFGNFYEGEGIRGLIAAQATNETKAIAQKTARRVAGVMKLLSEHLLTDRIDPDPDPLGSAKREKRNQLPWTAETHVLTVNVPAVRRAASTTTEAHESPCLHWRRGHHRTLHRGSEFEKITWVRPCLVGDPDKGFIRRSSYRLTAHSAPWSPTA